MVVDALPYESEDAVAEREVKMPVQQIAFDIPPLIASKLLTGEYIQWGGIVRDQAGRIVKHLKPVQIEQAGEQAINVAKAVKNIARNNKNAVIVVGVTVAAAAIAGGAAIYQHVKKSKQNAVAFSELNEALAGYMSAIDEGTLDVEKLDKAINAIDAVIKKIGREGAKVEIEGETFANLVRVIRDYTERLYDANSGSFDGKVIEMPQASDDTLENLRDYLRAQRSMFELAA